MFHLPPTRKYQATGLRRALREFRSDFQPSLMNEMPTRERVEDVAATKGRTFARQRVNAPPPDEQPIIVLPQPGYVTERRRDFIFRDEQQRLWFKLDASRYRRLHHQITVRANHFGYSGDYVLCVRPIRMPDSERVPFPDVNEYVGNNYTVEYMYPSTGRVTFGIIRNTSVPLTP